MRRRILVVTRNLPPLVGGMERLNWHMIEQLSRRADVVVVAPRGSAALAPPGVAVHEVPLSPLPCFLVASMWRALRLSRSWKPHVVLAGSGLTAPIALLAARACKTRSAAYVHGLDVAVRHFVYRILWMPSLRRLDTLIANSSATSELAQKVGAQADKLNIVHPGVDWPPIVPDAETVVGFRESNGLRHGPLLLSVGRLTSRKGMREFVVDVLPGVLKRHPDAMLLIVGDAPSQALKAGVQTKASIQAAADEIGIGSHIKFLGVITDRQLLSVIYSAADLHVFPVREIEGDPEGFGMVAIEAASHGVPTVAYGTGGVVDAVRHGVSGVLVKPMDAVALGVALDGVLAAPLTREGVREFASEFAWEKFGDLIFNCLFAE
jgi:phosphatidylinositol alpha-1,6-mannosyltransferase